MALPGNKTTDILRSLPPRLLKTPASTNAKILSAIGDTVNDLAGALDPAVEYTAFEQARLSMLLRYAEGSYLDRIGANYGIARHPLLGTNDDLYRQLIGLLAWLPKATNFCVQTLLEILLGTQASLVLAGKRPWRIYEFTNVIVIEVPYELTRLSNEVASYLHGISGIGSSDPTLPLNAFNVFDRNLPQDDWQASVAGLTLSLFVAGVWTNYVATTLTYVAVPSTSVIGTTTPVPAGYVGVPFYLITKGYRGDFLSPSHTERSDTSTTPPHQDRVYLSGDGALEVFKFYMLRIVRASGIVVRYERI